MERPGLRLFVAGAGPAYSDRPGALGSAYVVDAGGGRPVVLDLGQGTFPNLFRIGPPETFAAVLISHLHPDHYVDLVPLRHYLKFERPGAGPLRVVAPSDLTDRLDAAAGEDAFCHGTFSIAALAPGPVEVDGAGVTVEAGRVTHRGEAYGFRVVPVGGGADSAGLVYSGDCGRASDLEALIRPGDTLLSEVSFGTGPVPVPDLHLDAAAVGDLAVRTGVAAVLLTHLQMGYDPAATVDAVRARFGGPVRLVVPGDGAEIASEATPGD